MSGINKHRLSDVRINLWANYKIHGTVLIIKTGQLNKVLFPCSMLETKLHNIQCHVNVKARQVHGHIDLKFLLFIL